MQDPQPGLQHSKDRQRADNNDEDQAMSKKQQLEQSEPGRRQFLKTLTAAGAGAAVVAVSGEASAAEADPDTRSDKKAQGYRETDHIREYYKSARI